MTDDSQAVSSLFTDLYELSMMQAYVEQGMLNDTGLRDVRIFASGGLDEQVIASLFAARAARE